MCHTAVTGKVVKSGLGLQRWVAFGGWLWVLLLQGHTKIWVLLRQGHTKLIFCLLLLFALKLCIGTVGALQVPPEPY